MTSRRNFLAGAAALGTLPVARVWAARTSGPEFPFAEFEQRMARRDFRGMTKDILPTPALVVDLDLFQANIRHMADTAKTNGINVRPHVKVHKSVDVARHFRINLVKLHRSPSRSNSTTCQYYRGYCWTRFAPGVGVQVGFHWARSRTQAINVR